MMIACGGVVHDGVGRWGGGVECDWGFVGFKFQDGPSYLW